MKYLPHFVILILCCVVQADIVYLSNGSEIEGTTSQIKGRTIVKTADGQTKSFSEAEVLYIAKGPLRNKPAETEDTAPTEPAPKTKPAEATTRESAPETSKTAPAEKSGDKEASDELGPVKIDSDNKDEGKLSQCAQSPTDMLYEYFRRKQSDPGTGIEDLINTARVRIHDRMYKIGPDWVKPDDFQRRRKAYDERLAEVQGLYKDAAKLNDKDVKEANQKKTLMKNAQFKLNQAATSWLDPLTRWFLIGVAAYNSQDYNKAIQNFYRCISQAPWVAAFWQGLGDSMMAVKRHEDAMFPYMMMVEMSDNKTAAVTILRDALEKTPGTKISAKPVMDAKKFLEFFSAVKSSRWNSQRQMWLLPGKDVICKPDTLPQLPFDKFTFKQGVAVPVAPQTLLVGADVVKDADTVILRMRDWLYLTAKVETVKNEPIAILRIQSNVQLTPVRISSKNSFKRNQMLTLLTTDISPAMSTKVRDESLKVKDTDSYGSVSVSGGLLPGEGTSPVLDSAGELAGFLAGKLDVDKDSAPDRLLTISAQSQIAKRLMRTVKPVKNKTAPAAGIPIEGQTFVVFAVGTEKLEKK